MKVISRLLFLFIILYSIPYLKEQSILNNPFISKKQSNPICYRIIVLSRKISSCLSSQSISQPLSKENTTETSSQSCFKVLNHYDKFIYNSYALSQNFFAISDQYLMLENKLYKINKVNHRIYQQELPQNILISYFDYINGNLIDNSGNLSFKGIIIYGFKKNLLVFYSLDHPTTKISSELEDIDVNISCKLIYLFLKY